MRQGSLSSLPDESGRVLDRLAGLEQVIAPDVVRQCLSETGRQGQRSCGLNHEVMSWVVLAMGVRFNRLINGNVLSVNKLQGTIAIGNCCSNQALPLARICRWAIPVRNVSAELRDAVATFLTPPGGTT